MIVSHLAVTALDDPARREFHRRDAFAHLVDLARRGVLLAAGRAPDGRTADLICRTAQPDDLARLVEADPMFAHGLWTGYAPRSFAQFLEPWQPPVPRPDESRLATIVEGAAPDVEMASFALIEERGAGRLLLGGFFADGGVLAVMQDADPEDAVARLAATGLFTPGSLRGRPLIHLV